MKFSIKRFLKNVFGNRAKVVILGEGTLSPKVCVFGRFKDMPETGAMFICKYKGDKPHEFGAAVCAEDVGAPIVKILFMDKEGIKRMSDSLAKLYREMGGESET